MEKDMSWVDRWKVDLDNQDNRAGGQGTIRRVRRDSDGTIGALKELHQDIETRTERRYRLAQEVGALRVLKGNGTPLIYESNETSWENNDIQLYVIMEWIKGKTLAEFINSKALTIDKALEIINPLLDTIEACHQLGIYHRDLKPDNIILRNAKISNPILVDFGLTWLPSNEEHGFKTDLRQRIGNQFLQLPEYAPHRHVHDARSDLTMLVGILFYCVVGTPPRILRDSNDKMPHEVEPIPESLSKDRRWPRLNRLFDVAFQQSLNHRFQSPEQLRHYIMTLDPSTEEENPLLKAQEDLETVLKTGNMKELKQIAEMIKTKSEKLVNQVTKLAGSDFLSTGSYQVDDNGRCFSSLFGINLRNIPAPRVSFIHTLQYKAGDYIGSYKINETGYQKDYYRGPFVDTASLEEAVALAAKEITIHLISLYKKMLLESK